MAKKRKLNKRAVAVLIAVGAVVLLGAVVWSSKYWLRPDVERYAVDANDAFYEANAALFAGHNEVAAGHLANAEKWYSVATGGKDPNAAYLFRLAKTRYAILRSRPLTQTEKGEKWRALLGDLKKATLLAPNYVEPQQMLCDLWWGQFCSGLAPGVPALGARGPSRELIAEVGSLLRLEPNNGEALFRRGIARARDSLQAGGVDTVLAETALADLRAAVEVNPDDLEHWRETIQYLMMTGREAEVERTFQDAVAMKDANVNVALRVEYANYLRGRNRLQEAFEQIDLAIQRDPNDVQGYLARAEHLRRLNDPNVILQVREALATALAKDDTEPRIYQHLADLLLRENKFADANQMIRDGIARISQRLETETRSAETSRLRQAAWQMYAGLARLFLDLHMRQDKEFPNALTQAQECLAAMDRLVPDHPGRSSLAGMLAFAQGDLARSVTLLTQAMKDGFGEDPLVTDMLLAALRQLDQPTVAQKILEDLIRRPGQRNLGLIALRMAELKMTTRDFRGAALEITKALQDPASRRQAQNLETVLKVLMGDQSRLPEAVTVSPAHVTLLLDRVSQLNSERRGQEAVGLLEDLHREAPQNRPVISWLMDAYVASGKQALAEELRKSLEASDPALATYMANEMAIRKEPDPNKRYELRKVHLERDSGAAMAGAQKELEFARFAALEGLPEIARKHLEAAVQLDPNHPRVVERGFLQSLQEKDANAAQEWARRAATTNADGMGGHWYAARLAVTRQQFPEAIKELQEVLQRQPDSKLGRALLGDCFRLSGDAEKAQAQYDQILKVDASYFPAVKGMAVLTAGKPGEHETWVEQAARLPQGRQDDYVQQETMKLLERRADANSLPQLIEGRQRILQRDPGNLDNTYYLGMLYEQAKRFAESAGRLDQAAQMGAQAEAMFTTIYKTGTPKLDAARPLAQFYGRNDRLGDLTRVLSELAAVRPVDIIGVQILAGDSLSSMDANRAERSYKEANDPAGRDPRGYLALGQFYLRRSRWPEAVNAYREYQKRAPTDRAARFWTVYSQIQAGELVEAGKALADILATDPGNLDAQGLSGILAMRLKRYDEAEKAFDAALQGDTPNPVMLLQRARIYLLRGQPEKAKRDLLAARALTGEPSVSMDYAQICLYLGDAAGAEMVYRDVLARQKDYAPAMAALAELYLTQKNWVLLDPVLADARRRFPQEASFLLLEGRAWKLRSDSPKFLEATHAAAAAAPESVVVLSEYLAALLEEQQWQKAHDQAVAYASKPPMTVVALAVKGRALVRLGRGADAVAAFQAALEANASVPHVIYTAQQVLQAYPSPKAACEAADRWDRDANIPAPRLAMFLGALHLEAKDFPAAASQLAQALPALQSVPDRAAVGLLLGLAHYQAKDFPSAEQAFLEVVRASPDDLQARNNLAYLYANDLKDANRALPHARRALELAVGNPDVVDTYGWVLVQLKRYAEAADALRRAAAIAPANAVFRYHLGFAFEQQGLFEEALRQYDEGLRLSATDDPTTRADLQNGADRLRKRLRPE